MKELIKQKLNTLVSLTEGFDSLDVYKNDPDTENDCIYVGIKVVNEILKKEIDSLADLLGSEGVLKCRPTVDDVVSNSVLK